MREINTPAEMAELMKECVSSVRFYIDKAKNKCNVYLPYPRVIFSLQGATAGKAHCGKGLIEFSPTLLRENPDLFLIDTAGHEVAHLVAWQKFQNRIRPHGPEWEQVMWTLGLQANRCHNYNTSNVPSNVGRFRGQPKTIKINNNTIRPIGIGRVITFD